MQATQKSYKPLPETLPHKEQREIEKRFEDESRREALSFFGSIAAGVLIIIVAISGFISFLWR